VLLLLLLLLLLVELLLNEKILRRPRHRPPHRGEIAHGDVSISSVIRQLDGAFLWLIGWLVGLFVCAICFEGGSDMEQGGETTTRPMKKPNVNKGDNGRWLA
jgi:hypothetical protein